MSEKELKRELSKRDATIDALSSALNDKADEIQRLKTEVESYKHKQENLKKQKDEAEQKMQIENEKLRKEVIDATKRLKRCTCQNMRELESGSESVSTYTRRQELEFGSESFRSDVQYEFEGLDERLHVVTIRRDLETGSESFRDDEQCRTTVVGSDSLNSLQRTLPDLNRNKKGKAPLVAAFDIGTNSSGYAFSLNYEYIRDPLRINSNFWEAGSSSLLSSKAPTCILFDKNQQFHSFGYEAENKYCDLEEDGEHGSWYFFKHFKMRLHEKIHRNTEIEDNNGRKMPAMKVFAEVIRYFKKQLFDLLENRGTGMLESEVHFILTVPAIWTDSAKQFMREAASEAGIDGGQLSIALEPEAASLFCQLIPTEKLKWSTGASFDVASPGTKHMVMDLGGETYGITVLERLPDGNLKVVHTASGGAWGGTKIDEEFNQLLIAIIGAHVFRKFCDENKSDQLDLQRELEIQKRRITPGKITIKVPVAISSTYEDVMGKKIKDAIANSAYKDKINWVSNKVRIDADISKGLFKSYTDRIGDHVKELLKKPGVQGTKIFLMVGGFSESAMVQEAVKKLIKEVLPDGKVIIPEDAGLSVLKGAVIFGHQQYSE